MKLRTCLYTFCSVLLLALCSCLGNDDTDEYVASTDAEILSFRIKNDTISTQLDSVKFYIDQINNRIYNKDSVRFGTEITEKVILTFKAGAAVLNITNPDSVWLRSGDSIDITKPLHLRSYAYDGSTKEYWAQLNIHQIDPDSIQYHEIASNVASLNFDETKTIFYSGAYYAFSKTASGVQYYTSTDAITWTKQTITGDGLPANTIMKSIQEYDNSFYANTSDGKLFACDDTKKWMEMNLIYPVVSILGTINKSTTQAQLFCCVVRKDGNLVFATTPNLKDWVYGVGIPDNFPLTDFSSISFNSMLKERIAIVGGINSSGNVQNAVWSSMNGLYWAKLTDDVQGLFPLMRGANAFLYDGIFYLMNGKLEDGSYNKAVYISTDNGVSWKQALSKTFLPVGEYNLRYDASLITDKDNFIYIFGGRNTAPEANVWQGRLNKLN